MREEQGDLVGEFRRVGALICESVQVFAIVEKMKDWQGFNVVLFGQVVKLGILWFEIDSARRQLSRVGFRQVLQRRRD